MENNGFVGTFFLAEVLRRKLEDLHANGYLEKHIIGLKVRDIPEVELHGGYLLKHVRTEEEVIAVATSFDCMPAQGKAVYGAIKEGGLALFVDRYARIQAEDVERDSEAAFNRSGEQLEDVQPANVEEQVPKIRTDGL